MLTDFGTGDEAVYAVKSAVSHLNPRAKVEDICHDVPVGNILIGARRLQRAVGLPTEQKGTAYVVVVDPGVGTRRKSIIVKTKTGRYLVGPDNGVFTLALESEGIEKAVSIENERLTLLSSARSSTFHGKDVFAPVAAHITNGVPLHEFGPELDPDDLVRIKVSSENTTDLQGGLVDVDGFGSIRTSIPNDAAESLIGQVVSFKINSGIQEINGKAKVVKTFADAEKGDLALVQSSTGYLDLAAIFGNASEALGVPAHEIRLNHASEPAIRIEVDVCG